MAVQSVSRTLRPSLLCAAALGLSLSAGSAQAQDPEGEAPERRLQMQETTQFGHDGHTVFGSAKVGDGFVQFESRVVADHTVEVQLQTSTLTATFTPDFTTGALTMRTNEGQLVPADWRAIRAAELELRMEAHPEFSPIAELYLSRTLGMLAESEPHFVWESREVPLPKMFGDEASFYDADAYRDTSSGAAVAQLSRDEALGSTIEALATDVLARPPAEDVVADPSHDLPPGFGSTTDGPITCTGFRTDKADGNITCNESGNYYCVRFDYFPTGSKKQKAMRTAAPSIPFGWLRRIAAAVPVYHDKVLDGAYPCSGRCGPGCDPGPPISGGKAGGWGMGCLIHDHCVYQARKGQNLEKWYENWHNIQTSPSCGQEMKDAADDYYMPPAFCPGTKTVGGAGRWPRTSPSVRNPLAPRPMLGNTVSGKRARSAGKVKRP